MASASSSSSSSRSAVILFRDQNRGDSYVKALEADHVVVETIPVLEHQYLLKAADIDAIIQQHYGGKVFSAIVFTSQNAVRALAYAAFQWLTHHHHPSSATEKADRATKWSQFLRLPIFVVGHATGAACRAHLLFGDQPASHPDIRGEESGKGSVLLPDILQFCRQQTRETHGVADRPRLLFFCGDQRRDVLPTGIRQDGAGELAEVTSYTTVGRDTGAVTRELCAAVGRIAELCRSRVPKDPGQIAIWMVLFSPSGARVAVPILQALEQRGLLSAHHRPPAKGAAPTYRLAAIGHTTLSQIVALGVDSTRIAQADEPTEQGICAALRASQ